MKITILQIKTLLSEPILDDVALKPSHTLFSGQIVKFNWCYFDVILHQSSS